MADLSQLQGLPPQATGNTLPGQAQAAGPGNENPVQPVDVNSLLQDSNFGDGASGKISGLQQAGQAAGMPPEDANAAATSIGAPNAPPGMPEDQGGDPNAQFGG